LSAKTSPEMLELCERLNMRPSQINGAFRELQNKGFIVNMTPGREPIRSEWRLTMFPCDGRPATRDYLRPELVAKYAKPGASRNGK
jgi:hypothetical protein